MLLRAGSRVGPYEVIDLLGVGGMGEVWRARHSSLKREDALKILPDAVAGDAGRLARFQREAELLASLNHPNIAQLYGVEVLDGAKALVMELVDGETLADRIRRGPVPLDEALDIASQIARALSAAHECGVVHRDLKPANVRVRPDGTVKVLDFGLAKVVGHEPDERDASHTPTATDGVGMTARGVVLGTAPYMSPEQARAESVGPGADVWAFGCVLYEMLTGRRAFDGPSVPDVLVAVLSGTPDWSLLAEDLPAPVRVLLRRCLARDVRHRLGRMSEALLLLDERSALSDGSPRAVAAVPTRRRLAPLAIALLAGASVAAGILWLSRAPAANRSLRAAILADPLLFASDPSFAFTPRGDALVYIGQDASQILARRLDALEPVPILSTAAYVRGVFPSPDGEWIGFIESAFNLRKVPAAGGPPTTVLQMDGPSRGAAWGTDETIVFATGAADTGLQQVAASGGPVTVLTRPDPDRGEADHVGPAWLPDDRGVLFTISPKDGGPDGYRVALLDTASSTWRTVVESGYGARYVEGGYLVYGADRALWAVRFDLSRLETRGTAIEVLRPVQVGGVGGGAHFAVAADGTLAYPQDVRTDGDALVPVWVDREGRETVLESPPGLYRHPRLSPDGRRLAIVSGGEILVREVERPWSAASRMTFEAAIDWYPVWTPDGQRLVFGSWRGGGFSNLYWQEPGSATATRLTESADMQLPTSITPDGSTLVFHSFTKRIEGLPLDEGSQAQPFALVETPQEERNAVVSPDGQWLAYEAESPTRPGHLEVFVRPFPEVDRGLWQVSVGGGIYPTWCSRCPELYYLEPDGTVVAVPVEATEGAWSAGAPTRLFKGPYYLRGDGSQAREYDAAPDGRRFLMLRFLPGEGVRTPRFVLVQGWSEELARLLR